MSSGGFPWIARRRLGAAFAGVALLLGGVLPAAGAASPDARAPTTPSTAGDGLIAFRDNQGIGVIDPQNGQVHLLLAVPSACTVSPLVPGITLAGPVWGSGPSGSPELYFWVTDNQARATAGCSLPLPPSLLAQAALLVRADPFTGTLRVVALAPGGQPCQPGSDLVAVPSALGFTNGGCDETSVEALALPLRAGEQPAQYGPAVGPPSQFCSSCAIDDNVLGSGPGGTVLFEERGTQTAAPPPALFWLLEPATHAIKPLSPLPPASTRDALVAAASSPSGTEEAFSAGASGAGVLDMTTGAWSSAPLPACAWTCRGAQSVAFSPSGGQLAIASDGEVVIDTVAGGSPKVMLARRGVDQVAWSGPLSSAMLPSVPAEPLGQALSAMWAPFVASGSGASMVWQVGPDLPAGEPDLLVSLPGTPSALLMVSDKVALAAGSDGAMWRSTDGGHAWKVVTSHCGQLQMVTTNFPPCDIERMAALPGGVVLAGGPLGLWRSHDEGLHWQRHTFPGEVIQSGPWAVGSTALVLVEPAGPSGAPVAGAASLSLLTSSDGGTSWHELLAVPRRDPARGASAAVFDDLFVLGRGRFAELYKVGDCSLAADLRLSDDGGHQWRSLRVGPLLSPSALAAAGTARMLLASAFCGSAAPDYGQGIFTSPLGAGSWAAVSLPAGYTELGGPAPNRFPASSTVQAFSIAALSAPTPGEAFALGSQVTTETNSSGVVPSLPQDYGQELIFESNDGGLTWSDLPAPGADPLSMLSCADGTHCLAAGPSSDQLVLLTPPTAASHAAALLSPGSQARRLVAGEMPHSARAATTIPPRWRSSPRPLPILEGQ